jgi:2-phospho-L-lactate guanylyltransferase
MPRGMTVDLVVPVKSLAGAKSRLLGAADGGRGDRRAHVALVVAIVEDTLTAAHAALAVRRVLVVTPDPLVVVLARRRGAEVMCDESPKGLNAALASGAELLRRDDPNTVVGALQADLPALRPGELSAAVLAACGRRAFCADGHGKGTTLLLSAPGSDLQPRFGLGSACAHRETGAVPLSGPWPSLSCDVDDVTDLAAATQLGLGRSTAGFFARRHRGLAVT